MRRRIWVTATIALTALSLVCAERATISIADASGRGGGGGGGNCFNVAGMQLVESFPVETDAAAASGIHARGTAYRRLLSSSRCVTSLVASPTVLNDNQFSALVSAVSNSTCQRMNSSSLLSSINAGRHDAVYDGLIRYHSESVAADAADAAAAGSGVASERGLAEAKLYASLDMADCVNWKQLIDELVRETIEAEGSDPSQRPAPFTAAIATEQRIRHTERDRAAAIARSRAAATASATATLLARQKNRETAVAGTKLHARQLALLNAVGKSGNAAATVAAAGAAAATKAGAKTKVGSTAAARGQSKGGAATKVISKTTTKDGDQWWMSDEPWFLPPPDEWGPMPATMYTHYWHKPAYNNDHATSYVPQNSRPDDYDYQLPVAKRPRTTLTRQLEYDDYVDKYISHTHYNPTGDRNVLSSGALQYSNSAYFGLGGLTEGHARQLSKDSTNNYAPMFSKTQEFYFPRNVNSPAFAGSYNGGINSFIQIDQSIAAAAKATKSITRFMSSPVVSYRRKAVAAVADAAVDGRGGGGGGDDA